MSFGSRSLDESYDNWVTRSPYEDEERELMELEEREEKMFISMLNIYNEGTGKSLTLDEFLELWDNKGEQE